MKISTKNLHKEMQKSILPNVMFMSKELPQEVLKTLEGKHGDERTIDVKVLFNGIEYDGSLLEEILQDAWSTYKKKVEGEYADVNALVEKRVSSRLAKIVSERQSECLKKLEAVQDKLTQLFVDIECIM